MQVLIEISARHAHLSAGALEALFGKGHELKKLKGLSQKGEFAAEEKVVLKTPKGELELRIIGPIRPATQVELSATEARKLGLNPPVRLSGNIAGSEKGTLAGPAGEAALAEGIILAKRHIHISDIEAEEFGLANGQIVSVKVPGPRSLTFHDVEVRAKESFSFAMHIDTDEANAANVQTGVQGFIEGIQSEG